MSASQRRNVLVSATLCLLVLDALPSSDASRFVGLSSPSFGFLPRVGQRNEINKTPLVLLTLRGGDEEVLTLDEKVRKAMSKLGIGPPPKKVEDPKPEPPTEPAATTTDDAECEDGVCPVPDAPPSKSNDVVTPPPPAVTQEQLDMDVEELADKIADDMNVHPSLAMAALGATSTFETANPTSRQYNEALARSMIQQELGMIENVAEDCEEVQQLVAEGYDTFLSRRALAFSDMNMEDARAILLADKMDEEEEEEETERNAQQSAAAAQQQPEEEPEMKTVTVDANFDPASIGVKPKAPAPAPQANNPQMPKAARKEDVVFEATTAQIQELVIDSPVPVLLDIYADW